MNLFKEQLQKILNDPYCQQFVEAMAEIVLYQARQKPDVGKQGDPSEEEIGKVPAAEDDQP